MKFANFVSFCITHEKLIPFFDSGINFLLQTSQGYIFHLLQHFTTTLCNFTKFKMLFNAVIIYFYYFEIFQNFVHYAIGPLQTQFKNECVSPANYANMT